MKGQVGNAEGSDAEELDESDVIKNAPKDVVSLNPDGHE